MNLGLTNKVALVCAASRGLGFAVAEELAENGCNLALCAREPASLRAAAHDLAERFGVQVIDVPTDLTVVDDIDRVVDTTRDRFGRIDILLNNVGGPPPGTFDAHDHTAWSKAYDQCLRSVVETTRRVLPGMRERRFGRVLNVASIAVKQPVANLMLSNSLRAAVVGFAKSLANEVALHAITVNNLLPGYTETERLQQLARSLADQRGIDEAEIFAGWAAEVPMQRVGTPREFAALAAFLASERASYITGQSIAVDGGCVRGLL